MKVMEGRKKKEKRTLYVLGAGASIGAKKYPILGSIDDMNNRMPSAEHFFYDLFKVKSRGGDFLNFMAVTNPGLYKFLLQSWGLVKDDAHDPANWKNINVEEVLSYFDIGLKMADKNSDEKKIFAMAKNELIDFFGPMLTVKCDGQHCEYLQDVFFNLEKNDCVISYNWDTLADHTLDNIGASQMKMYAKILQDSNFDLEKYKGKGFFIKLHGSLNWRTCDNKKCKFYSRLIPPFKGYKNKFLKISETYNCPSCGNKRPKTLLVPPVSDKLIHKNSLINKYWLLARDSLLFADRIIFIGYSFPTSDYYSEWLFRSINYIEGKEKPEIVVVNPEYKNKKSIVFQRYNKIFRGCSISNWDTLEEFSLEFYKKEN